MNTERKQPSLWQVICSVLASFIGVQSDKNRARDFKQGKISHYIIVGALATLAFVLVLWGIVKWVLSTVGV